MCGLFGAFSPERHLESSPFRAENLELLRHRGPDAKGWHVEDHAVLGFRRLAILDLLGGGQPLYSEDEQIVLTINGEIYNHHELRDRLKESHRFRTRVDGEVLIHLYEEHGLDFLAEVNGMFGFALYDRTKRRLILGRDRAGMKPLFYRFDNGAIHFASEMKPLLREHRPAVSREALSDYLRFGYVPAPLTILEGVSKLASGSMLVMEPEASPRLVEYWKPRFEHDASKATTPSDIGQWEEELRETLRGAVQLRLESEVPLGFLLSGGIDSASVFALGASALRGQKVKAFTIGFQGHAIDESEAAGQVASRYGAAHRVIQLERTQSMSLDDILYRVEEPVSTDALYPTACVFDAVRKANITTILSGEGADELFAGYGKFSRAMRNPAAQNLGPLERYLLREEFSFPERAERRELLGEDIASSRFDEIKREAQELDPLSQMLLFEIRLRLPDRINLRLDRTSMSSSIEARAPFMDHSMIDFAARIPHAFRTGPSFSKQLLRSAMRDLVPPVVIDAPKVPFHAPDTWFTEGTNSTDLLSRDAVVEAGLVRPEAVQVLRDKARNGDSVAQEKVFSLFVLHAWHRAFYQTL